MDEYVIYRCTKCNKIHRISKRMEFYSKSFNMPILHCSVKCFEDTKNDNKGIEGTD